MADDQPPRVDNSDYDRAIQVAVYALERERAAADQIYARMRSLFNLTLSVFAAAQAAVVAVAAGTRNDKPLLIGGDKTAVLVFAGIAIAAFCITAYVFLTTSDRGVSSRWVTRTELETALVDHGEDDPGFLLVEQLADELDGWHSANITRSTEMGVLVWLVVGTVVLSLAEVGALIYVIT